MASTKDLLIMMNQADSEGRGPVDRCKRCNKLTKNVLWQHGAVYLKDEWRDGEEKWTPPIDENDAWQRKWRYQRQQGEEASSETRQTSWHGQGKTWQKSKTKQETSWPQWRGKARYQNSGW